MSGLGEDIIIHSNCGPRRIKGSPLHHDGGRRSSFLQCLGDEDTQDTGYDNPAKPGEGDHARQHAARCKMKAPREIGPYILWKQTIVNGKLIFTLI